MRGFRTVATVVFALTCLATAAMGDSIRVTDGFLGGRVPSDFMSDFTLFGEEFSMTARAGGSPHAIGPVRQGNRLI